MTTECSEKLGQESGLASAEVLVLRDRLTRLQRKYDQLVVQAANQAGSFPNQISQVVPSVQPIAVAAPLAATAPSNKLIKLFYRAYPSNPPEFLETFLFSNKKPDDAITTEFANLIDADHREDWSQWTEFCLALYSDIPRVILEKLMEKKLKINLLKLVSNCREIVLFLNKDIFVSEFFSLLTSPDPVVVSESLQVMKKLIVSESSIVALIQTPMSRNLFLGVSRQIFNHSAALQVVGQALTYLGPVASGTLLNLREKNGSIAERVFLGLFSQVWNKATRSLPVVNACMNILVRATSLGEYAILVPSFLTLAKEIEFFPGDLAFLKELGPKNLEPPFDFENNFSK